MEIDDLLTDAQDAFFEGNLQTAIELCEKVLEESPKEKDAFELLALSYMQRQPPDYAEVMKRTLLWGKTCGNDVRQLKRLLKVAYHTEDKEVLHDTIIQLLQNPDGILRFLQLILDELLPDQILAAALLADLGDYSKSKEMVPNCDFSIEIEEEDETAKIEMAEITRMKVLSAWINAKDPLSEIEGLQVLESIASSSKNGALGVDLTFALLAVHHLEKNALEEAKEWLQKAKDKGFGEEQNVMGALALFLKKEGTATPSEIRALAQNAIMGANSLITKRLEKGVLYSSPLKE